MIILLVLLIIGASTFVGWQIKNYYAARERFFKDIILFCDILLAETNFNKTPLKYIIEKNEKQFHKEFLKSLKSFEEALNSGADFQEKNSILKESEKQDFTRFFSSLGKTNLENHNNLIGGYKSEMLTKQNQISTEEKKKGNAIFKICICIGFAIAILCI